MPDCTDIKNVQISLQLNFKWGNRVARSYGVR